MKNVIIACVWILLVPVIITNLNLKLIYKINSLNKEIMEFEKENAYLKKKLAQKLTLSEVYKKATALGFKTPEPSTVIIIDEKSKINKFIAKNHIINQIIKNFLNET